MSDRLPPQSPEDEAARSEQLHQAHIDGSWRLPGRTPEDEAARQARRRARRGRLTEGTRREGPGDARVAATLRARGADIHEIATALEFSYQRARHLLKRVDVQQLITKFREVHRVQTVERAADMTPRVFRRMEQAINDTDPEAVAQVKDLAKTVLDLERVAASASGELKPASTTIQIQNQMLQQNGVDAKQQLETLLATLEEGET